MAKVELSNVSVLIVGVTRLVSFEAEDRISTLATLEGSPVPAAVIIEYDLVRLDFRLGMGDTVIVNTPFDGEALVDGYGKGCPVPSKLMGADGGAV